MNTKICARCGIEKQMVGFHKNLRNRDGLHSYCKTCNAAIAANYQKTDKGKIALRKAIHKKQDQGYYRYGKGAIPILLQGAKKRGITFDFTAESLENWWHSQPDICSYCGMNLDEYKIIRDFVITYNGDNFEIKKFMKFYRSSKHKGIKWMTIDRIINEKGYEPDNMCKACWICNSLKNDFFDGDQMRLMAPKIISKLKREIDNAKV